MNRNPHRGKGIVGYVDEEQGEGIAPDPVAAAQAQLAAARSSGESGTIGIAHMNLGMVLAATGDHASAIAEYAELISYLQLAQRDDDEAQTRRWLRLGSLSAPVPDATDMPPAQLEALARIHRAASLLMLGQRQDAAAELDAAQPACRGFGKGWLRKQWQAVRNRMDEAASPAAPSIPDQGNQPTANERTPAPSTSLTEQIAAADELLGQEQFPEAARIALRAIDQCGEEDLGYRAQARQVLGIALEGMGRADDALSVLGESFTDYISSDQPISAARIAIPLAWRQAEAGQLDSAMTLLRQALRFTESAGEPALRAQLLTDLASMADRAGERAEARKSFEAAIATAEMIPDPERTADARHGLAIVLAHSDSSNRDDEVEALTLLDECSRSYRELGFADRVAGCEHESAALLGRLGSSDAALKRYRQALDLYRQLPVEQRDTGSWPDEIADLEHNIAALAAGQTSGPGLFASGGHTMSHQPPSD